MTRYPQANKSKIPGFIVKVKDVPRAYWEKHKRAWDCGLAGLPDDKVAARIAATGVAIAPESEEVGAYQGGASRNEHHLNIWCWIPASYFEPVMNEYGEVAP